VVFSLLYLGICRVVGFIVSSRRSESDKDIEIMVLRHQVHVLDVRSRDVSGTGPPIEQSSLLSAVVSLGRGGGASSSPPTPSCVGTGNWPDGNGVGGEHNVVLAGRR
jgi:hypothetical protein